MKAFQQGCAIRHTAHIRSRRGHEPGCQLRLYLLRRHRGLSHATLMVSVYRHRQQGLVLPTEAARECVSSPSMPSAAHYAPFHASRRSQKEY